MLAELWSPSPTKALVPPLWVNVPVPSPPTVSTAADDQAALQVVAADAGLAAGRLAGPAAAHEDANGLVCPGSECADGSARLREHARAVSSLARLRPRKWRSH